MRLRKGQERPRPTQAIDALVTEQSVQSEIFDPRVDLPPGELGRIQAWVRSHQGTAQEANLLVQTAWIGWVDPAYVERIRGNADVKNAELSAFLDRRNGKRLELAQIPDDPDKADEWRLTEKTGAYLDFVELVEVFPEVRGELQKPEFADDFLQVRSKEIQDSFGRAEASFFDQIRSLKVLIQVWPEHRTDIIQTFAAGGLDTQRWFIEQLQAEPSIVHAVNTSANLLLVFPELRPQLEGIVKSRMKEIKTKLEKMRSELRKEGGGFYRYDWFLKSLTILGAESAFLDVNGDLQVKLRRLSGPRVARPLPEREAA